MKKVLMSALVAFIAVGCLAPSVEAKKKSKEVTEQSCCSAGDVVGRTYVCESIAGKIVLKFKKGGKAEMTIKDSDGEVKLDYYWKYNGKEAVDITMGDDIVVQSFNLVDCGKILRTDMGGIVYNFELVK